MSNGHKYILSSVALVCLAPGLATNVTAKVLEGGIEVREKLPAVPPELRAGVIFNEANLPPLGTTQEWRKIPYWCAGTWHREKQTTFLRTGPVTTRNRTINEQQKGEQADRNGGIWTHTSLPGKDTGETRRYIDYNIITNSEPILANETQLVQRRRAMTIRVKKSNHRIAMVLQKEQFDTDRPEGKGAVFQDGWITEYSEHGRRLLSQHFQAHLYQIYPFAPINIDPKTGLDLRQDFKNYLLSHGLANLVPVDESAQISNAQATTH